VRRCLALLELARSGLGWQTSGVERRTVDPVKARRSRWIDDRTARLLSCLAEYELAVPEDVARQLISDHLDGIAERMRIGRQAARYYFTDEAIQTLADELVGSRSSADASNVVSLAETRRNRRSNRL
jgi:hypothetical protein